MFCDEIYFNSDDSDSCHLTKISRIILENLFGGKLKFQFFFFFFFFFVCVYAWSLFDVTSQTKSAPVVLL